MIDSTHTHILFNHLFENLTSAVSRNEEIYPWNNWRQSRKLSDDECSRIVLDTSEEPRVRHFLAKLKLTIKSNDVLICAKKKFYQVLLFRKLLSMKSAVVTRGYRVQWNRKNFVCFYFIMSYSVVWSIWLFFFIIIKPLDASKPFPVIRQRNGETASRHVCNPKWRPDQKVSAPFWYLLFPLILHDYPKLSNQFSIE